jgi:predicted NBD/HSP70 family sugar kinase
MSPGTAQFLPLLVAPGPARNVTVLTEDVLGAIAEHVGGTGPCSKADLVREMGLPRSTVTGHVDWLLNRGVLAHVTGEHQLKRGRPAESVALNGAAGWILAVEMGALKTTVAVVDLAGAILARRTVSMPVSLGPEDCVTRLSALIEELADRAGTVSGHPVARANWVAAVALPARIDLQTRRPLRPTIMPNWDGYPVGEAFEEALGCPVLLENDCSVRALGEVGQLGPEALPLISIQIGTGVGAGIIDSSGLIIQGANGAAGDVGHIPSTLSDGALCSCGARGCVDTVASVAAMLDKISRAGVVCADDSLEGSDRLLSLVAQGGPEVTRVIQESAEAIGEVVASLCNVINPRRVVITSALAAVSHELLAGVRSVVYSRARPLATKDLVIDYSQLGNTVGIAGAYLLGRRFLLSSGNIKKLRDHAKV